MSNEKDNIDSNILKELLDRKEKLAVNQIDGLNKRIVMNQSKVNQNRGVPGLENEVERIDAALKTVGVQEKRL